ncbi:hypothetical protein CQ065_16995 [Pseudomonas sp. MYb187]|nr:hypothetical protein CQ065_16995 [Pseudomonas sp. MYb187]
MTLPTKALGVSFTADEFHGLCHYARRHAMPVPDFIEYMVRCYINAMRADEQATASKNRGR